MKNKQNIRTLIILLAAVSVSMLSYAKNGSLAAWVSGSDTVNENGIYGTQGVADPANIPGARYFSISWTDSAGSFWLFGGNGYDSIGNRDCLNDLWKFDGTNWTWISGSNMVDEKGTYGKKGIPDPANIPGARYGSITWTDSGDNLWLFGGYGYDRKGDPGHLNDLWKFDGTNWTWISGSNTVNENGIYGTQGVADPANIPGARYLSVAWTDSSDNFWLSGGDGYDSAVGPSDLNDLWKFDGTNWTWVSGSDAIGEWGVYGTQGAPDPANIPGARWSSIAWTDAAGNLWLFGGVGKGYYSFANEGLLNDLWKFDGTNWTWFSGSGLVDQNGFYGTQGVADPANTPGSRGSSISWADSMGNFWLFGGGGYDSVGDKDELNDLWKFDGTHWMWVGGSDTVNERGIYGTKGIPDPANIPGARAGSISWSDGAGNLWLFGGHYQDNTDWGYLNDLWKFELLDIYYVDESAVGTGDGSSWTDAFNYLQDALAEADAAPKPVQIWVAEGTYKPDRNYENPIGTGDRRASFQLINQVALYGGFPAGGGSWTDRDPITYETILSGDLAGNDADIDDPNNLLNEPTRAENSYHLFYHPDGTNLDETAILDGFTITAGNANGVFDYPYWDDRGGGMYNSGSKPTMSNCIFTGNAASYAGGIYNSGSGSSPTLTHCTFKSNAAITGGAMANGLAHPTINNCTFINNLATGYGGGGAIENFMSKPAVTECTFIGNSAKEHGGAVSLYQNSEPILENCVFTRNTAVGWGGGMYSENSTPTVINCSFNANEALASAGAIMFRCLTESYTARLTNCTFTENSAVVGGGVFSHFSDPIISDCTFIGNSAWSGGGLTANENSNIIVKNCIFKANNAEHGGGVEYYNSDLKVMNCIFIANEASGGGGGIYHGADAALIMNNCSFSNNSTGWFGGGIYSNGGSVTISNCTLWENLAVLGSQICLRYDSSASIEFCNIQGGQESIFIPDSESTIDWGEGNIDEAPLLTPDGHLRGGTNSN